MANKRMFLKCNICGKAIYLGAHLGGPWAISQDDDDIASFFRRHYRCLFGSDLNISFHKNDFSLVYEGQGDYELEYINQTPDYVKKEIQDFYRSMGISTEELRK